MHLSAVPANLADLPKKEKKVASDFSGFSLSPFMSSSPTSLSLPISGQMTSGLDSASASPVPMSVLGWQARGLAFLGGGEGHH